MSTLMTAAYRNDKDIRSRVADMVPTYHPAHPQVTIERTPGSVRWDSIKPPHHPSKKTPGFFLRKHYPFKRNS